MPEVVFNRERHMTTEEAGAPEWDEDDKAMEAMAERKWRHIIGHECGHATAALANGKCPDKILIGQLGDEISGKTVPGLAVNSGLPDDAPAEAKATVLLAGLVAEELIFGSHSNGAERDLDQLKPLVKEVIGGKGEERTEAKVREDLLAATKSLLEANKQILEELYEEGVRRAADVGFVKLNEKGIALELLNGEMLRCAWDELKPKP